MEGRRSINEGHEEYVVVDRAGRLQVPKEFLSALGVENKVSMEFDGEKIIIKAPNQLEGNLNEKA